PITDTRAGGTVTAPRIRVANALTAIAPPASCPCSLWNSTATPAVVDAGDPTPVEVGVRFQSDVAGYLTALRFYKSAANTGPHVGKLWTATGTLLASVTFINETASGWQQMALPIPVPITAGTQYVASYYAPNGHFSYSLSYFATSSVDTPPLHAPAVVNGVGTYTIGTFPTGNYLSTNYWVDVVLDRKA